MATQAQGTDIKRPLISIRNVSLSYGNFQALSDVSVDFHQGEMVGLLVYTVKSKSWSSFGETMAAIGEGKVMN